MLGKKFTLEMLTIKVQVGLETTENCRKMEGRSVENKAMVHGDLERTENSRKMKEEERGWRQKIKENL